MSMFCYQCQEAAKGTGCEVIGVCGKKEDVAKWCAPRQEDNKK